MPLPGRSKQDDAVSSVVGTVLMLGVTVTVFGGLAILVLDEFRDAPSDIHTELGVVETEESYILVHEGGDPIDLAEASLQMSVEGSLEELEMTEFALQTEDGSFLRIGETICLAGPQPPCYFEAGTDLRGTLVIVGTAVLASFGDLSADPTACVTDTTPPVVSAWTQSPPNVNFATTGPVTVTARVTDACWGVAGTPPHLWARIDDGSDPAFQDQGVMSRVGLVWTGQVADLGWSTNDNLPLEYYVGPLADQGGNTGDSAVRSDYIEGGIADPGFPFEDVDGDALYRDGLDIALAASDVIDGAHDAGVRGFVIPASVGSISTASIAFAADGVVRIDVSLTATTGNLQVDAGGDLRLGAVGFGTQASAATLTLTAGQDIEGQEFQGIAAGSLTVNGRAIDFARGYLSTTTDAKDLRITGTGAVSIAEAGLTSRGDIVVIGTSVAADQASLTTLVVGEPVQLQATAGALSADTAQMASAGTLSATATGAIDLDSSIIQTSNAGYALTVSSSAGAFQAEGAQWTARGPLSVSASGTVLLSGNLDLLTAAMDATIQSTAASVDIDTLSLDTRGHITVLAATGIASQAAALITIENAKDVSMATTAGNILVQDSVVRCSRAIALTVASGAKVHVLGATFDDANDKANIPNPTSSYAEPSTAVNVE